jgi:hypothetical protein
MLKELYSAEFSAYCKKLAGPNDDDLIQEIALIYLKKAKIKNDCSICWLKQTAKFLVIQPRSVYNKAVKPKQIDKELYITVNSNATDLEPFYEALNKTLQTQPNTKRELYKKEIFKKYIEVGSARRLAKEIKISHQSITNAVNNFKNDIRRNYKDSTN